MKLLISTMLFLITCLSLAADKEACNSCNKKRSGGINLSTEQMVRMIIAVQDKLNKYKVEQSAKMTECKIDQGKLESELLKLKQEDDALKTELNELKQEDDALKTELIELKQEDDTLKMELNQLKQTLENFNSSGGTNGPMGVQGRKGDSGVNGQEGPKGDAGQQGATGQEGPTGPTGPSGQEGLPGPTGQTGQTGPKGDTGSNGSIGPNGAQGPEGPQGLKGAVGQQGTQGPKGDTGTNGQMGTQGLKGDPGIKGDSGPTGPRGLTGGTGPTGQDGPIGQTGPKGLKGLKGSKGPTGSKGDAGSVQKEAFTVYNRDVGYNGVIRYSNYLVQEGTGMDIDTGKYTVPVAGHYVVSVWGLARVKEGQYEIYLYIKLDSSQRAFVMVDSPNFCLGAFCERVLGSSRILHARVGQQLYVELDKLAGSYFQNIYFSAYLLYED